MPVVIRDPVWEQSFPPVGGVGVPIVDPRSGRVVARAPDRAARLRDRRDANEERQRSLLAELAALGLDPVVLGTSDPDAIDRAFIAWAELRKQRRWAR